MKVPLHLALIVALSSGSVLMAGTRDSPRASFDVDADPMARLYKGRKAATWEQLEPYTGRDAYKAIVGERRQQAYRFNYEQLGINYGDNVEFQLRGQQVILCPQTAEFLYGQFTPRTVRYRKGTRPMLEKVVAKAMTGCENQRDKMLALMRYCRDLYEEKWYTGQFEDYVYGGTEEQLIEKGEILCECLGRLMVVLCEVAGMPGRIVMHDVGGHICAEILVDGQWAYVDPRCGIYFLKAGGSFASVWELWQNPGLIRQQSDAVKADVSKWWAWEARAFKAETRYFHPNEVNGFENYSLADASRYRYDTRTRQRAVEAGLLKINKKYVAAINDVFGLAGDGYRFAWDRYELRRIPIAYRHDGFSMYYKTQPPMTRAFLEKTYVDPFKGTNAPILVWGLGPGSVFCYDTKVGQVFGAPLTDAQWKLMRTGDRHVYDNVMGLIKEGNCPLKVAVERGRELGLKIIARLEMNHEYGPASDDNWLWVGLVGDFNKRHPEYRIPRTVMLDYKHKAVRDFKLAIFREAAEAGVDGLALDFAVYFPHFEKPDCTIMTQFVRDVRAMLDDVGGRQNRWIEIMARVPFNTALKYGLDWKTWMKERLIDTIVPTHRWPNETFDIAIEEFVSLGNQTGVAVFPTVWQALGFVSTDLHPSDEKKGVRRYSKPKTQGMYFAQALLFHRAGADGLQLGFSDDQWLRMPWLNDLADPAKVTFADKHYMVDAKPHCPVEFPLPEKGPPYTASKTVPLRIGDDVAKARREGYDVTAKLVFYLRPLRKGERLEVAVNGNDPVTVTGDDRVGDTADAAPIDPRRARDKSFIHDRSWWRRGETPVSVKADWFRLENNAIQLTYSTASADVAPPFTITWIDLLLDYERRQ